MNLKDLHDQVMVKKNETDDIISAPKNGNWSNYLCQLERPCGYKF